jgi:hypothetical protein
MTELKWLKLSGLMHQCVYNRENLQCPFIDYRNMDNIQQYQALNNIGPSQGDQLLSKCASCRIQNKEIKNTDLVIKNTRHFRIVG